MPHRLNLKHLHHFWRIARCGSITAAGEQLGLTPQTLSSQLASLEEHTGPLFVRKGRTLKLNARGEEIRQAADEIFRLVEDLDTRIRHAERYRSGLGPLELCAGINASIHKLTAYQLLKPALSLPQHSATRAILEFFRNTCGD